MYLQSIQVFLVLYANECWPLYIILEKAYFIGAKKESLQNLENGFRSSFKSSQNQGLFREYWKLF